MNSLTLNEQVAKVTHEMLLEYANSRKFYREHVEGIVYPLIIHWCLVKFCSLNNLEEYKEHWKDEIRVFMQSLFSMKTKSNFDKLVATKEAFTNKMLYDGIDFIAKKIKDKFKNEHIEDIIIIQVVAEECYNNLDNIAEVLANANSVDDIINYINTI